MSVDPSTVQSIPPNSGTGLSQTRVLPWVPPPQLTGHSGHELHSPQPPLTWKNSNESFKSLVFKIIFQNCLNQPSNHCYIQYAYLNLNLVVVIYLGMDFRYIFPFQMHHRRNRHHHGLELDYHIPLFWCCRLLHKRQGTHSNLTNPPIHRQLFKGHKKVLQHLPNDSRQNYLY